MRELPDPMPMPHSLDGVKMPPDGTARPEAELGLRHGTKWMKSKAIGTSAPAGEDFGPYVEYLGEGIFPSFKLDFTNHIPFSTGGVHPHTGIVLFGLALNIRPEVIIETGTWYGYSTMFLARACELHQHGKVYTMDPQQKQIAREIRQNPYIECIPQASGDGLQTLLDRLGRVDLAFIDSWKRLALWELCVIEEFIPEGGMVVFHDTQLLNTGHTLYEAACSYFPDYDKMLLAGKQDPEHPHRYFGNADERGLFIMQKKRQRPFLEIPDSLSGQFGNQLLTRPISTGAFLAKGKAA